MDNSRITFAYRPSGTSENKTMTLPVEAFLQRFLQLILPKGFVKVRYYGYRPWLPLTPGSYPPTTARQPFRYLSISGRNPRREPARDIPPLPILRSAHASLADPP